MNRRTTTIPSKIASSVPAGALFAGSVVESAREIPVAFETDVVVCGGGCGAVAAAQAAAQAGARVFLVAPRPYLGDDLAGTLRLWLEEGETPISPLARRVFGASRSVSPLQAKTAFDEVVQKAGIRYLTGCCVTDLLVDKKGKPAGIVMSDRAGRQAIRAKVVVDATERSVVARLAGAKFSPYPAGLQTFSRVVIGGRIKPDKSLKVRSLAHLFSLPPLSSEKDPQVGPVNAWEVTLQISMADGTWASFSEAEQIARDKCWDPGQIDAADSLFHIPPDVMKGVASLADDWPGSPKLDVNIFRPAGITHLWALSGCADMPRTAAASLLRPLNLMDAGARVGRAAAKEAKNTTTAAQVSLVGKRVSASSRCEVRELLQGVRPFQDGAPMISIAARSLPVLGTYDVVIIGGGTGGAPAGIGAGRQKAKTLVVEYLYGLGGVGTQGLIGRYWFGNRVGFTAEHDAAVKAMKAAVHIVGKAEYWRQENRQAGVEIWFGCLGCGTLVENEQVKGVVIATPMGRGVVWAKTVIDATGNADIAAAAGAACGYTSAEDLAVQGTGLPPRNLGASHTNTDYAFADDTDVVDIWNFNIFARQKFKGAWDTSPLVDTRERRRIVGDFVLSPVDELCNRTYPDSIVLACSNFDSHGHTIHPLFFLHPLDESPITAYVPYRCLRPMGLDGILVTGLGISAHRDAMPVVRMQPDIQNQGYAAGVAAALAARSAKTVRTVNFKTVQKHLVALKILPKSVLSDKDSFPLSARKISAAVHKVASDYQQIEIILSNPAQALPGLKKAYRAVKSSEAKLIYAHILGMLGDATGAQTLAEKVEASAWDKGWNFRGMGQFGASVSRLDSLVIALGRTQDERALAPLLARLRELDPTQAFSHHRAMALALDTLGDPAAAGPLAELLNKPGMRGFASVQRKSGVTPRSRKDGDKERNEVLRELTLARALYRLGDHKSVAEKILRQYENDPHGHFARHAHEILRSKSPS